MSPPRWITGAAFLACGLFALFVWPTPWSAERRIVAWLDDDVATLDEVVFGDWFVPPHLPGLRPGLSVGQHPLWVEGRSSRITGARTYRAWRTVDQPDAWAEVQRLAKERGGPWVGLNSPCARHPLWTDMLCVESVLVRPRTLPGAQARLAAGTFGTLRATPTLVHDAAAGRVGGRVLLENRADLPCLVSDAFWLARGDRLLAPLRSTDGATAWLLEPGASRELSLTSAGVEDLGDALGDNWSVVHLVQGWSWGSEAAVAGTPEPWVESGAPPLPDPVRAGFELARAGDHEASVAELERAVATDLDPAIAAEVWMRLGNGYLHRMDRVNAIEAYRVALGYDPHDHATRRNLAVTLHLEGRRSEAMVEANRLRTRAAGTPLAWWARSLAAQMTAPPPEALARLRGELGTINGSLEASPNDLELLLERARLRVEVGDVDGAFQDLDRAVESLGEGTPRRETSARVYFQRGRAHGMRARVADALVDLDVAANLTPEDPEPALWAAYFLELRGDLPGALEAYDEAHRRAPDRADVVGLRAHARAALGDEPGRAADLARARELAHRAFRGGIR